MKTIKYLFVVMFMAMALQLAETKTTQASPTATFQRIIVRTGPVVRRGYRRGYYHRPYRRPVVINRWHRRGPWRRPYRRY